MSLIRSCLCSGGRHHSAQHLQRAAPMRSCCQQVVPARRPVKAAPLADIRCRNSTSDVQVQILQAVQQLQQQMRDMQQQMRDMQQDVSHIQGVQQDVKQLQQQMRNMQQDQGYMLETQARAAVAEMFGADYSRPLAVQSLQDLALLLPMSKNDEVLLRPLELAQRASQKLVNLCVPHRLLTTIYAHLAATDPTLPPWFDEAGKLLSRNLGSFIGSCQDEPLKEGLRRLRNAVAQEKAEQSTELLKCDSAGVMCILAIALPHMYLDSDSDSTRSSTSSSSIGGNSRVATADIVPAWVLEFDFRGRMDVGVDYAYVDVGEAKVSADYASAVPQLGVRLRVLRWLVHVCFGVPEREIRCVGRLFVSRGRKNADLDEQQRRSARDTWQYSLYLHEV